jgi:membrane-bound lytic murein transglycosylase MltF
MVKGAAYQESGLNEEARSPVARSGVMQQI